MFLDDELLKESQSSNFYAHRNGLQKQSYKETTVQKQTYRETTTFRTTTTTTDSNSKKNN